MRAVGLQPIVEVYGLFAHLLPQHAHGLLDAEAPRKRQGLVPDFMMRGRRRNEGTINPMLMELKTLHHGSSTYPASEIRCNAVARRAATIHSEYLRKARWLDQRFLGVQAGHTGPVELKLRGFGEIKALVFGAWAEASDDIKWLLEAAAQHGALRHSLDDAETRGDAAARMKTCLRRKWGLAACQANARLLLDRLGAVGPGAAAAANRRSLGSARFFGNRTPTLWPASRGLGGR